MADSFTGTRLKVMQSARYNDFSFTPTRMLMHIIADNNWGDWDYFQEAAGNISFTSTIDITNTPTIDKEISIFTTRNPDGSIAWPAGCPNDFAQLMDTHGAVSSGYNDLAFYVAPIYETAQSFPHQNRDNYYCPRLELLGKLYCGQYCDTNSLSYNGTNLTLTPHSNIGYIAAAGPGIGSVASDSDGVITIPKNDIPLNSTTRIAFVFYRPDEGLSIQDSNYFEMICNKSSYTQDSVLPDASGENYYYYTILATNLTQCSDKLEIGRYQRHINSVSFNESGNNIYISTPKDNSNCNYVLYIDNTFVSRSKTPSWTLTRSDYFGQHTVMIRAEAGAVRTNIESKVGSTNEGESYYMHNAYYSIYDPEDAVFTINVTIPVPTNLSVLQNGLERASSNYVDSIYVSWDSAPGVSTYKCQLLKYYYNEFDSVVETQNVNTTNCTFSNLSYLSKGYEYIIQVRGVQGNLEGNAVELNKGRLSYLPTPTSLSFTRTIINGGTLTWSSSYADTALTYYEVFDGNTSLGTTNNTTYSVTGLSQGSHSLYVIMRYNNTANADSGTFNSARAGISTTLSKLPTPVLTSTDVYDNVIFRDSDNNDCYLLTDGAFVKVSEYTSGNIKQGITGVTFSYPINPSYDLTGVSYAFYDKLGNNAYQYDTSVSTTTRTIRLGDVTYGSVGTHKVKIKATYSGDSDYNSADSNEVEYSINTLDAPTPVWGDTTHASSQVAPTGYTTIEYIESDGTQYIDTGYAPEQFANIDMEFMYLGAPVSGDNYLYGAIGSSSKSKFALSIRRSNGLLHNIYSTFNSPSPSAYITANGYSHIRTDAGEVYLNNQLQSSISTTLRDRTTPDVTMCLLGLKNAGGTVQDLVSARIYDCNIYNGTTLVRQFIPVVRNSDDVPGLYDLVNEVFYPSATEYDFTAGPTIELWDSNKIYESRIEWMPVTTVSSSNNYADYYYVEVIGNDVPVGNAVTIMQPEDLTTRVGTWIPDPDPINGATKGLIAQLPAATTNYTVNVRALSFNSWYVGGSASGTATYTINRLATPQNVTWISETNTLSWQAVTNATTYYIYDNNALIKEVTGATSYTFTNLEDGLHQFKVSATKRTFAVN